MSKAFYSLHLPLFLRKLDAYGFLTSSTSLIRSYFTERKYRVKIGTEITCEWKEVLRGCPQDSSFGPLLWNTFQNDLNFFANEHNLTMYADNHWLYSAGQMVKEVQDTLNKEREIIFKWYKSNLLKDSNEKYQIISMGPKDKTKDLGITMSNVKIKCDSDLKLLGLTTDQKLDFSKQVSEVCKQAGRKVGAVTLRIILSARAKLITYKSVILPQLTYCHIVWNFCCSSDNRKLKRIQERALRAIYNRKSGTYDELLKLAKLPTLKNRRRQDIAILMYKVQNEPCPSYSKEILQNNNINLYSL